MASVDVRAREDSDRPEVESFLAERHSARVARLGRLEDSLAHPALVAERNGELAGVLTYVVDGFRLAALHAGAVDHSRAHLKPEIPRTGEHGIDLRDELELEKVLGG